MQQSDQTHIRSRPGNNLCAECGHRNPQWASVSFGTLVCLECSGTHRGLGVHISFVRSVAMDSWTDKQLTLMREGGNDACNSYLADHGIPKTASIRKKYDNPTASLYREILKAKAEGREPPTSLPPPTQRQTPRPAAQPAHGDTSSMERLPGESEQQYVARQTRLKADAAARLRAKFGGGGMGGGGMGRSSMGGVGSDPNYNPGQGYGGGGVGGVGVDDVMGAVGSGMSMLGGWTKGAVGSASSAWNQAAPGAGGFFGDVTKSTGSFFSSVAKTLTEPEDDLFGGDDGLASLKKKAEINKRNDTSGRYIGFGVGATPPQQQHGGGGMGFAAPSVPVHSTNIPAYSVPQPPLSQPAPIPTMAPTPAPPVSAPVDLLSETNPKPKKMPVHNADDFFQEFGA